MTEIETKKLWYVGQKVYHIRRGEGIVKEIREENIIVSFDGVNRVWFLSNGKFDEDDCKQSLFIDRIDIGIENKIVEIFEKYIERMIGETIFRAKNGECEIRFNQRKGAFEFEDCSGVSYLLDFKLMRKNDAKLIVEELNKLYNNYSEISIEKGVENFSKIENEKYGAIVLFTY